MAIQDQVNATPRAKASAVKQGQADRNKASTASHQASEVIHRHIESEPTGDGHAPALRSLECREGRAGRRLEVDDPTI